MCTIACRILALFAVILLLRGAAYASGVPDERFGSSGIRRLDLPGFENTFHSVTIDGYGRLVAAGRASGSFVVARFTVDGELDQSFGDHGTTLVDVSADADTVRRVLLQPDGRILLVGDTGSGAFSGGSCAIARLTSSGELDSTYGLNGVVKLRFFDGTDCEDAALTGGKLLVAGTVDRGSASFFVARIDDEGSLDRDFGDNGRTLVTFRGSSGETLFAVANSLTVLPSTRIIIAGYASGPPRYADQAALARLDASGELDGSFGNGGMLVLAGSDDREVYDVALDSAGRMVLVGGFLPGDGFVARISQQGILDSSFGKGGWIRADADWPFSGWWLKGATVQPDGRIVVVGQAGAPADIAIGRLNADGSPDGSFGTGGFVKRDIDRQGDFGEGFAVGRDGRISVVGLTQTSFGSHDGSLLIARYRLDPPPEQVGAMLEVPPDQSFQSGIGLISGWACSARQITLEVDGAPFGQAAYGTGRGDTVGVCGDADNGFGMLLNWNLLQSGFHHVVAKADGVPFGESSIVVTTMGAPFVRGLHGEFVLSGFPDAGSHSAIRWSEPAQNFVVIDPSASGGTSRPSSEPNATEGGVGVLEVPPNGGDVSGIGVVSGWVCESDGVSVRVDGTLVGDAGYGTSRSDTEGICGDVHNGFGMLLNWNLFGEGAHALTVESSGATIGSSTFRVAGFGVPFLRGKSGRYVLPDFNHRDLTVEWQEAQQNFVIRPPIGVGTIWGRPGTATPTPTPRVTPRPTPRPTTTRAPSCCRVCTTGKACGDSCIARSLTCHQPPGCACNG